MQNNLIHRIVILIAFMISVVFFIVQLSLGYDFLEAAYTAACIMMAGSVVLLIALQCVVKILFEHLTERQKRESQCNSEENIQAKDDGMV